MNNVLNPIIVLLVGLSLTNKSIDFSVAQGRPEVELPSDVATAVRKFIDNARSTRIDNYGNVHLTMIETTEMKWLKKPATLAVNRIEFFSCDDKFFRVDSTVLETKALEKRPDAARTRFILCPEGFILLGAGTEKDAFALIDWGTVDEGIVLLFNQEWMQRSARAGRLPADLIVDELVSNESSLPDLYNKMVLDSRIRSRESLTAGLQWTSHSQENLKKIEFSPDGKMVQFAWDSESVPDKSWSSTSSMSCLFNRGVVTFYECEFVDRELGRMTQKDSLDFDFERFGVIPKTFVQRITNTNTEEDSYTSQITWEIKEVDFSRVPLGVFSFEAQGITSLEPESVWSRRLSILLVAIALFLIVGLVKWARHRAT